MIRRLIRSGFLGVVICGCSFYLAYFLGLIQAAITGPANPANDTGLQWTLRHLALPGSLGLGVLTFLFTFWGSGRKSVAPPSSENTEGR